MGGERCATLELTPAGIAGDRQLAFSAADAPTGKPLLRAAARAAMLRVYAVTNEAGIVLYTTYGDTLNIDDPAIPEKLARELDLPAASVLTLIRSLRPLTDVRPIALHSLQSTRQLAAELDAGRLPGLETGFDPRRLRSNLVLDLDTGVPFAEDALTGHTLQIGNTARLRITERIPRCRIVSLAPETAAHHPTLLKHLAREHNGRAGIYARPVTPGTLRVGDPILLAGSEEFKSVLTGAAYFAVNGTASASVFGG